LRAQVGAWRALAERAVEPNVFAEPECLLPALKHLPDGRRAALLLVWRGAALAALWPVLRPRVPLAPGMLRAWRPAHLACGVPLLDRDAPEAALEQALGFLAGTGSRYGGVSFPDVAEDGAFADALRAAALRSRRVLTCLRVQERAHLAGEPASLLLRGARPQARRVEGLGEVRLERARDPAAVRDAVEELLVLDALGARRGGAPALLQDPGAASFLRTMSRDLARRRRCRVDLLRLVGRAVAAALVLESGSRAWCWRLCADPDAAGFDPASELAGIVARAAGGSPVELCETFGAAVPGARTTRVADYAVAVRPDRSAGAAAALAREAARRRVRDLVNARRASPTGLAS
jgi:CelD/BcsL family acetyltransferase involved in cellulose biosynthesis